MNRITTTSQSLRNLCEVFFYLSICKRVVCVCVWVCLHLAKAHELTRAHYRKSNILGIYNAMDFCFVAAPKLPLSKCVIKVKICWLYQIMSICTERNAKSRTNASNDEYWTEANGINANGNQRALTSWEIQREWMEAVMSINLANAIIFCMFCVFSAIILGFSSSGGHLKVLIFRLDVLKFLRAAEKCRVIGWNRWFLPLFSLAIFFIALFFLCCFNSSSSFSFSSRCLQSVFNLLSGECEHFTMALPI